MKTLILLLLATTLLTACQLAQVKTCPENYYEELSSVTDHAGNTMTFLDIDCDRICDMGVFVDYDGMMLVLPCEVAYEIVEEYNAQKTKNQTKGRGI